MPCDEFLLKTCNFDENMQIFSHMEPSGYFIFAFSHSLHNTKLISH